MPPCFCALASVANNDSSRASVQAMGFMVCFLAGFFVPVEAYRTALWLWQGDVTLLWS